MELFAHHTTSHTLSMREVALFGALIIAVILIVKIAGANK